MKVESTESNAVHPAEKKDDQRLREACRDFEAIFIQQILKGLRKTVPGPESRQEAVYQSLLDGQLSKLCSKRKLGLADMLYERLARHASIEEGSKDVAPSQVSPETTDELNRETNR